MASTEAGGGPVLWDIVRVPFRYMDGPAHADVITITQHIEQRAASDGDTGACRTDRVAAACHSLIAATPVPSRARKCPARRFILLHCENCNCSPTPSQDGRSDAILKRMG